MIHKPNDSKPSTFTFYDVEASGMGGYPIEVGWATVTLPIGTIDSGSMLIRPTEEWTARLPWLDEAERIHGISRDLLKAQGRPPAEVTARLNALFPGQTLFCDAPQFDIPWTNILFAAANVRRTFQLASLAEGFRRAALRRPVTEQILQVTSSTVHRAEADARRWALFLKQYLFIT